MTAQGVLLAFDDGHKEPAIDPQSVTICGIDGFVLHRSPKDSNLWRVSCARTGFRFPVENQDPDAALHQATLALLKSSAKSGLTAEAFIRKSRRKARKRFSKWEAARG